MPRVFVIREARASSVSRTGVLIKFLDSLIILIVRARECAM